MRGTLRCRARACCAFILMNCMRSARELSLAAHLADVSQELRALAERSPDTSPHRSGEPYRLAVSGIYARLAATARAARASRPRGRRSAKPRPMPAPTEFKADLDVLDRSLIANKSQRDRARPAAACCAAPWIVSASISPASTCGRTPPCMSAPIAELLDAATPGTSYLALNEEARIALLPRELRNARPLTSPFVKYSEETVGELAVFHAAAEAHARFGADVDSPMHHLDERGRLRSAGGRAAAEGGRPGRSVRPQRHQHRAAVRDHRGFAGLRRASWTGCCRCRNTAGWSTAAAACRK